MSRRCLQLLLTSAGYAQRNLSRQIAQASKARRDIFACDLFLDFAVAIRDVGNSGAHPPAMNHDNIEMDVEYEEAEWCLNMLESLLYHFYEAPALYDQIKMEIEGRRQTLARRFNPISNGAQ